MTTFSSSGDTSSQGYVRMVGERIGRTRIAPRMNTKHPTRCRADVERLEASMVAKENEKEKW